MAAKPKPKRAEDEAQAEAKARRKEKRKGEKVGGKGRSGEGWRMGGKRGNGAREDGKGKKAKKGSGGRGGQTNPLGRCSPRTPLMQWQHTLAPGAAAIRGSIAEINSEAYVQTHPVMPRQPCAQRLIARLKYFCGPRTG